MKTVLLYNKPRFIGQAEGQIPGVPTEARAEYDSWVGLEGEEKKKLFLAGYQYVAAMTSPRIRIFESTEYYEGPFKSALEKSDAVLEIVGGFLPSLSTEAVDDVTTAVEAKGKGSNTWGQANAFVNKYKRLRDQVVDDLVKAGYNVAFEYFGDDPNFPDQLVPHQVLRDGAKGTVNLILSNKSPRTLVEDLVRLEELYTNVGVAVEPSPVKKGKMGAGPILLLAGIAVIIVGIIGIFHTWWTLSEKKKITDATIQVIQQGVSAGTITQEQAARQLQILNDAHSFFGSVFGADIPWNNLLIGAGVIVGLAVILPAILSPSRKSVPGKA